MILNEGNCDCSNKTICYIRSVCHRGIEPSHFSLPTKQTQRKDNHSLGGIRTRNTSKQAAADPRFRARSNHVTLKPFLESGTTNKFGFLRKLNSTNLPIRTGDVGHSRALILL